MFEPSNPSPLYGLRGFAFALVSLLLFGLTLYPANAHRQGESYVYLNVGEDSLGGHFEITLSDLGKVMQLDTNGDGALSEDEINQQAQVVYDFFQPRLSFYIGGKAIPVKIESHAFLPVGFGTFLKLEFTTPVVEKLPDAIDVEHRSYFDEVLPNNRVLLIIETNTKIGLTENEATHSLIFGTGTDRQTLSLVGAPKFEVFWTFLKHGVVHILIGLDHVAFLFALLLPSVLTYRQKDLQPVARFRDAFINVLKVVTLFTLAHSVTLSLAALGWVSLPERLIETLIALSVVLIAADNIFSRNRRWIWIAVFALGLLHGLGFANVLAPLGVAKTSIFTSLLGFNVGVEIGQAAIIAVCFPILFLIRKSGLYIPVVLRGGSAILLLIAVLWFFERAFAVNVPVIPFLNGIFS